MSGYHHQIRQKYPNAPQDLGPIPRAWPFPTKQCAAQLPVRSQDGQEADRGGIQAQADSASPTSRPWVQSIGHGMRGHGESHPFLQRHGDLEGSIPPIASSSPLAADSHRARRGGSATGAAVQMDAPALQREGTFRRPCPDRLSPKQRSRPRKTRSPPERRLLPQQHRCPAAARSGLQRLIDGGIREQAAQCLRNIKTVLEG